MTSLLSSRRGFALLAASLFTLGLSACSTSDDVVAPIAQPADREGLAVTPAQALLDPGASLALHAALAGDGGQFSPLDVDSIEWVSSNPSIAHVSPLGVVRAFEPGVAVITARLGNIVGTAVITVAWGSPAAVGR